MTLRKTMQTKVLRTEYELLVIPSQYKSAESFKRDLAGVPDDAKFVEWWSDNDDRDSPLYFKFVLEAPETSEGGST